MNEDLNISQQNFESENSKSEDVNEGASQEQTIE